METHFDLVIQGEEFLVGDVSQEGKAFLGVLDGVQGDFWIRSTSAFSSVAFFLEGCIFFLQPSRVLHDYWKQLLRRGSQNDVSCETFLDKLGNEPRVV
jgi:hypothetical protein